MLTFERPQRCRILLHILAGVITTQIQYSHSIAVPGHRRFRQQFSSTSNELQSYDQRVNDFEDFNFISENDHQHYMEGFDLLSNPITDPEMWDEMQLFLLIGRRKQPGRKNRIQSRNFEKSRPHFNKGRIQDHLSRLAVPRKPGTSHSSVENLHASAGPPYVSQAHQLDVSQVHQPGVSQAHQPDITFAAYEAYPPPSLYFDELSSAGLRQKDERRVHRHHNRDFVPSFQLDSEFQRSDIRKRGPTQGRAFEGEYTSPTIRQAIRLNEPQGSTSNRLARRDKFKETPTYTFALADGVHRNYKRFNPTADVKHLTGRSLNDPSKNSQYFFATIGYPDNSWKRIEKKELDYYT